MPWVRQEPSAASWSQTGSAILLTMEGEPILTVDGDQAIFLLDQANASWAQSSPAASDWEAQG